jgi:filamentous hemagglutinin family protein
LNFGRQSPVTDSGTGSAENPAPGSQPAEDIASPQAQAPSPSEPAASRSATAQTPTKDATASPANQPQAKSEPGQKTDQPASGGSGQTDVALNVAKPQLPATDAIGSVADRVSWLRDYSGGDCFYATATSATDKAMEIEGFGASAAPFDQMLIAFRAKFHIEPVHSFRLIEPTQCNVTNLLRSLDGTAAAKPKLALDQTSVASGSPVSGTLETQSGLISNVFLIDHKGMAFNLGDRVDVQSGKATFSIPIGLGAADKAAGKAVPQIMMVVTGPQDVQAASFSTPVPASVLLPKILDEIRAKESEFSATAKYFLLGG